MIRALEFRADAPILEGAAECLSALDTI